MKKLFVLFAVTLLVAVFASTSMAADWKFYGSARVSGWSIDNETGAGVSSRSTRFQLQNNTRLGAKVSAGKIYGRFEFGINPDDDTGNPGYADNAQSGADNWVYTRLLFGVWDFGAGKLLVGQDYTPCYLNVSAANNASGSDSVMIGRGTPYPGRRAQLRLEFGEFHIALVDSTANTVLGGGTVEKTIPKIEAKYTFKFDPVSLDIAGGYLSYDVEQAAPAPSLNVDAYMVAGRAKVNVGPAKLGAVIWWAQNANELGLTGGTADGVKLAGPQVVDNDTVGLLFTIGYKLSDMIEFEAGYGKLSSEQDGAGAGSLTGDLTEDERVAWYLQSTITMAKGVYIVPEVGVNDAKSNSAGNDEGKDTYFGAKFQIDF